MKKTFFILILSVLVMSVSAQSYEVLSTGAAGDSLTASSVFAETFKISAKETPTVSVQVSIDSVSGTPSATATLYQSLDNVNWISTGQTATFTTGVDTTFILTDTSFYGIYGKLSITGTATAQKSLVKSTMKSWNKR